MANEAIKAVLGFLVSVSELNSDGILNIVTVTLVIGILVVITRVLKENPPR